LKSKNDQPANMTHDRQPIFVPENKNQGALWGDPPCRRSSCVIAISNATSPVNGFLRLSPAVEHAGILFGRDRRGALYRHCVILRYAA
jgi:hypothetical protein